MPSPADVPVNEDAPPTSRRPRTGVALCLSGGGYRAMLFHLGSLWRLNEAGLLPKLSRVSSVSGGSIAAGVLALRWSRLRYGPDGAATNFEEEVVRPLRALAGRTIDVPAVLYGLFTPTSVSDNVALAYRQHLFGDATLQDLPAWPRFVFNASNVQSGALWRFSRPYMRDYRVGEVRCPLVPLAVAVTASSAFPPFLSPVTLDLPESAYTPGTGDDLQHPPYTTHPVLTDGGVYDNLGLQTAENFETLLVSDGGAKTGSEPEPARDWLRQTLRVLDLVDNQVRSRRKIELIGWYQRGERRGAYWGIRTDLRGYGLPDALPCPPEAAHRLAAVPTRLARMDDRLVAKLMNWGYAACDAALRRYVDPALAVPTSFIYPEFGV